MITDAGKQSPSLSLCHRQPGPNENRMISSANSWRRHKKRQQ